MLGSARNRGIPAHTLAGTSTGVFAGAWPSPTAPPTPMR
ncbi:type I polyketide synthase domain protein [Mycobacterium ulcerans str. Harvey]|uniref:Type I polyketide synthase domain protein n=1 Tax=Mycobacterium ulcerans str. Harvey TaxID=1299332 RepID=A0ABP3ARJ8_MYCUL|nr:type I polyketide synthase domain protein [Mycobacterium ulcerans str. Harvey]